MPHLLLTDPRIDRLPAPAHGEAFHRDTKVTGLAVRVTAKGTRTFVVEARMKADGKVRRESLGRFHPEGGSAVPGALNVDEARAMAMTRLAVLADGAAPAPPPRRLAGRAAASTLAEVLDEYLRDGEGLKPRTVDDYRMLMRTHLEPLAERDVRTLTFEEIRRLAQTVGKKSPSRANASMRLARALLNYAAAELKDAAGEPLLPVNPFPARLPRNSRRRVFYRTTRRSSVIRRDDLPAWWKAVQGLTGKRADAQSEVARDYLLTLLFSGLRKNEAARLQAQDVDLRGGMFVVGDTKNWQEHALPLSDPLAEIFARRLATAAPYLFPNRAGTGPFAESTWWVEKVREASGVHFMLHDLRRTFVTIADAVDVSSYTLKRLLNHKGGDGGDVTAGYVVRDVGRLREPMQRIAAAILGIVKP